MDIRSVFLSGYGPILQGVKSSFRGGSAEFSVEHKYSFYVGLVCEFSSRV